MNERPSKKRRDNGAAKRVPDLSLRKKRKKQSEESESEFSEEEDDEEFTEDDDDLVDADDFIDDGDGERTSFGSRKTKAKSSKAATSVRPRTSAVAR